MAEQTTDIKKVKPFRRIRGIAGINYKWITRNIGFFLFLAALAVLYIANGHLADKRIRDINVTAKELKELQYEYKTLKSEMMFKSRETEMIKAAEPLGLRITDSPLLRINLITRNDNK